MAFFPGFLLARVGQPVEFTNSEQVPHNVTIRAAGGDSTVFNADTGSGEAVRHVFHQPGAYQVACAWHAGMNASIYVVSSAFAVVAEDDGAFSFSDVPPGDYVLSVWSAGATRRFERPVHLDPGGPRVDVGEVLPPG